MKFREERNPVSYLGARQNLKKGLNSLGLKIPDEELQFYKTIKSPLENIVLDLYVSKNRYWILPLTLECHPIRVEEAKIYIEDLRTIIHNAISTLSAEELLTVNFDTNRNKRTNLIAFLGEIGEVSLFKAAFLKLEEQLPVDELQTILLSLQHSYEGSEISEAVGLASTALNRGHYCYIALADWMLDTLYQQDRAVELIALASDAIENLVDEMNRQKNLLAKNWPIERYKSMKWVTRPKHFSFDEVKFKAKVECDFKQFVIEPNYENLFLKSLSNFVNTAKPPSNEFSASFLLSIFESKELLIAAGILIVLGAIALTIGTMGIGGLTVLAGTATAYGLAFVGGTSLGLGLCLGAPGFFSSCAKKRPSEMELETNFYIGQI